MQNLDKSRIGQARQASFKNNFAKKIKSWAYYDIQLFTISHFTRSINSWDDLTNVRSYLLTSII